MNKIRCIAIDDEPFALEIIADDIKKVAYLDLIGTFSSPFLVKDLILEIDLIFLDIQMPTQTGIQFLKNLESPPMVIFTTAYQQYALEGFDLQIVDYLLKPIPFDRFTQATDKARTLFELKQNQIKERHFFTIFVEYKRVNIYSDEIIYIEGLKDYVKIYLENRKNPILTRLNMKSIETKLPVKGFCRVHNSYIVSEAKITSYGKSKIFLSEIEIPRGAKFLENFESNNAE